MKVGIVAGEKSGDYLGAELIAAIRRRHPDAQFVGLAGPLMLEAGATTLDDMDKISIMGIAGALKGLREILSVRRKIRRHMLEWQPDVFIGIDVPDFNLSLEIRLKEAGIPVVHYVSPTVWAWRSKRIVKIKRAVDLMLTLFPFEENFYQRHRTRVKYVGHPLARPVLSWQVSPEFSKTIKTSGQPNDKMVAILPGSRASEVSRLAPIMIEAALTLKTQYPELSFVIPAANPKLELLLEDLIARFEAPIQLISGHSRDVLASCHLAVLASGTAALEAALFAKPMVVMYKVAKFNEWYAARTMVVKHFSMPNHLTDPPVVPELIQENATVANLVKHVGELLSNHQAYQTQQVALAKIASALSADSGELACDAIDTLLADRKAAKGENPNLEQDSQ